MKVSQLDYTAIRAANAAQAQANSAAIAVESMGHANNMVAFNSEQLDRNTRLDWAEFGFDMVMDTLNTGYKAFEAIKQQKAEADGQDASTFMTSKSEEAEQFVKNLIAEDPNAFFSGVSEGNDEIIMPQQMQDFYDSLVTEIKSKGYDKDVEEQTLQLADKLYTNMQSSAFDYLYEREYTAKYGLYEERKGQALTIAAESGDPQIGIDLINNTSFLTPSEKALEIEKWNSSYDAQVRANETSRRARTEGQDSANEYINGLIDSGKIDENEWYTLSALANRIGSEQDQNLAQNAVQYASEQMAIGVDPVTINEQLKPNLEAMDESRRKVVQESLNNVYYQNALDQLNWPQSLTYATGPELRELEENLNDRAAALLPDMETEQNQLKALIQAEYATRDKQNADANIESQKLIYERVLSGQMSTYDGLVALSLYQTPGNSDSSDEASYYDYRRKLLGQNIPSQYKDYVEIKMDAFDATLKSFYDYDFDEDELEDEDDIADFEEFNRRRARVDSMVIEAFRNTAAEDVSYDFIDGIFEKAGTLMFSEGVEELEKLSEKRSGRELTQFGVFGDNSKYLQRYTDTLLNAPEGIVNADGTFNEAAPPEYKEAFDNVTGAIIYTGEARLGEVDRSQIFVEPYVIKDADGNVLRTTSLPVVNWPNGNQYMFLGDIFREHTPDMPEGTWRDLPAYGEGPENMSTLAQSARRGLSELRFTDQAGHRIPQGQTGTGNADRSAPTEAVVRNVDGRTQFRYNGGWYYIDTLDRNSEILQAYDNYIRTHSVTVGRN